MSKVPYRKTKKVKKAKKKFDKKLKKDKAAEQFYIKEQIREAAILEQHMTKQDGLKDEIKLDLLQREKKKDELTDYQEQRIERAQRERLEKEVAMDLAVETRERARRETDLELEAEQTTESRENEE